MTYILLASLGMGLGTALSCRFAQSTVSPLQSHTWGQTDSRDSSAPPEDSPRNSTVTHTAEYMARSATRDLLLLPDKERNRRKSSTCRWCLSVMSIILGVTVDPSQQVSVSWGRLRMKLPGMIIELFNN